MACCGQGRTTDTPTRWVRPAAAVSGAPIFEYVGMRSLAVIGTATGREYRFNRSGARVEVDSRDQPYVALVPNLRRVTVNR